MKECFLALSNIINPIWNLGSSDKYHMSYVCLPSKFSYPKSAIWKIQDPPFSNLRTVRLEVVVVVPASSWDAVVVAVVSRALGEEEGSYISYLAPYCWWKKSCTTWDVQTLVNSGTNYISTGAGFLPSTVVMIIYYIWVFPKIMVPPNHPLKIGFSIINHPFWGSPIFGNIHITYIFLMYTYMIIHVYHFKPHGSSFKHIWEGKNDAGKDKTSGAKCVYMRVYTHIHTYIYIYTIIRVYICIIYTCIMHTYILWIQLLYIHLHTSIEN